MLNGLFNRPLWFKLQLLATLLLLIPIWSFQYLPLNDWPNHLASMRLLTEYDAGQATYVQPNPIALLPNSTVFYFMRWTGPFIGVETAGRLLLSLYIVLMPWALSYLLKQFHPHLEPLGLAGAALSYNWFFSMGFLNFALCLPLFLLSAGFWMENRKIIHKPSVLLLASALFTLTFLTHLVAAGALALLIFFVRLRECFPHLQKKSRIAPALSRLAGLLKLDALAFLPSILLGLWAFSPIFSAESTGGIIWSTALEKLQYVFIFPPAPAQTLLGIGVLVLVVALSLGWKKLAAYRPEPFMAALALLFLAGALLLPESTSSWQFAAPRLLPFAAFIGLIALALPLAQPTKSARPPSLLSVELPIALLVLVLLQLSWLWPAWSDLQAPIHSISALSDQMPPHAAVWPLGSGFAYSDNRLATSPYFHAWGYWVLQKDVFVPTLFDAAYSPIAYAPSARPAVDLVSAWLTRLVSANFASRASDCANWNNYWSQINWTAVAQHYDYVALREGACDNRSAIPPSFAPVYSQPPLYLYKTNKTSG